jgi:hypothetical protein
LQLFNVFSREGWILATGRFVSGIAPLDAIIIIGFLAMMAAGIILTRKDNFSTFAFIITLIVVGILTTFRGIRFTEFASALFLVVIGAGFGQLMMKFNKDAFLKSIVIGFGIFLVVISVSLGYTIGQQLGPDINQNWDDAWNWIKTETPELSIIGTWWDPGHMIAGIAERRNIADGAHCQEPCKYTINDRITDLGKIMAGSNENESFNLVRKYQGSSPKAYWIASDDLIGKFRWVQYFGTGCDGVYEQQCPLYYQIPSNDIKYGPNNEIIRSYSNVVLIAQNNTIIPMIIENNRGMIFNKMIYYITPETSVKITLTEEEAESIIDSVKPLESFLNIKMTNLTVESTIWMPSHYAYVVIIPPNLENAVFTRMFMLEVQGLEHFKQVYRNEQVKIYEVTDV